MKKDIDEIQKDIEEILSKYNLDEDEVAIMLMLAFWRHGGEIGEE